MIASGFFCSRACAFGRSPSPSRRRRRGPPRGGRSAARPRRSASRCPSRASGSPRCARRSRSRSSPRRGRRSCRPCGCSWRRRPRWRRATDFFAAAESPFLRRTSSALAKSPPASASAFLQSIIPAPVFSRSSFTIVRADLRPRRLSFASLRRAGLGARGRTRKSARLERGYAGDSPAGPPPRRGGGRRPPRSPLRTTSTLALAAPRSSRGGPRRGPRRSRRSRRSFWPRSLAASRSSSSRRSPAAVLGDPGAVARLALEAGLGDLAREEPDRADGVVVAGDDVVDPLGVAVRVDHRDDRDAEAVRLVDGDVLLLRVDHEEGGGQPAHAP